MADSVVKIRIDSKEYDAQLKKCSDALNRYFNTVREGGGTLEHLDEGVLDAVKAIGNMKTQATQSRQQLREMQNALTDLLTQYRSMTDAEQASPLGKEMKKSIDTLTERAGVLRDAMDDVQATVRHSASDTRMFDEIAGGVQLATEGYQGFIGAANLLGFEVGENVEVIAKLQSAMALSNSVTQIQNLLQKESALMMGVKALQTRAAAAAEAMATKNTVAATAAQKAFNLVAKANPYMLLGSAALAAITSIGMFSSSTDDATDSQKEFNAELDETTRRIKEIISAEEELAQTREYLGGLGTKDKLSEEFKRLRREWDALENERLSHMMPARAGNTQPTVVREGHMESYNKIVEEQNSLVDKMNDVNAKIRAFGNARDKFDFHWQELANPREIRAAISYFTEKFNDLNVKDSFDPLANYYSDIISQLKGKLRKLPGGSLTGGGGGNNVIKETRTLLGDLEADLKYLQDEQKKATNPSEWYTYGEAIKFVTEQIRALKGEVGVTNLTTDKVMGMDVGITGDMSKAAYEYGTGKSLKERTLPTLDLSGYTSSSDNDNDKYKENIEKLAGGLTSLVGGVKQIGIKVPDAITDAIDVIQGTMTVIQAVTTIIQAFNALTASSETANTTALTANTVALGALTTAIYANSAVEAIPLLALGGIPRAAVGYRVPGNFNSGDMLPVAVNSGELILNHAQQGNLAAQLEDTGSMPASSPYVEGENIILGVNHTLARRGQGELVTTATLRRYGLIK